MLETIGIIILVLLLVFMISFLVYDSLSSSKTWKEWSTRNIAQITSDNRIVFKVEIIANDTFCGLLSAYPCDKELLGPIDDVRGLIDSFDGATVMASHSKQVDVLGYEPYDDGTYPDNAKKVTVNVYTLVDTDTFNYGDCLRSIEKAMSKDSRLDRLDSVWIDGVEEPDTDLRDKVQSDMDSDIYKRQATELQRVTVEETTNAITQENTENTENTNHTMSAELLTE